METKQQIDDPQIQAILRIADSIGLCGRDRGILIAAASETQSLRAQRTALHDALDDAADNYGRLRAQRDRLVETIRTALASLQIMGLSRLDESVATNKQILTGVRESLKTELAEVEKGE